MAFLVLGRTADAQAAPTPPPDSIVADSIASAEFRRDSIGSITVGIVAGDRLIWTRSYGYADMAAHRLATRRTVYRIGSITKPFTAVMLLQLVEAGTVHLSDPVERYLPEFKQVQGLPAGTAPPTILQLATMAAGLPAEPRNEGPFWTGPVSQWETTMISALGHTSYAYTPGTQFSYSNIGYAILGAALGRACKTPYVTWEQQHVLMPLGMTRTRFEVDSAIARDLAVGYVVANDGSISDTLPERELRTGRGYKVPNGALFTTVDDLARFVAFELGHGPESVLPRSRLEIAYGDIIATNINMTLGYGLGFMAMRRGDFTWTGHSGSVAGYTAAMYYDRSSQLGVIVFRNATGGKARADVATTILERLVRRT
jgi:CubicO group peptidase (beta-lactamase class C family)